MHQNQVKYTKIIIENHNYMLGNTIDTPYFRYAAKIQSRFYWK